MKSDKPSRNLKYFGEKSYPRCEGETLYGRADLGHAMKLSRKIGIAVALTVVVFAIIYVAGNAGYQTFIPCVVSNATGCDARFHGDTATLFVDYVHQDKRVKITIPKVPNDEFTVIQFVLVSPQRNSAFIHLRMGKVSAFIYQVYEGGEIRAYDRQKDNWALEMLRNEQVVERVGPVGDYIPRIISDLEERR